MFVQIRSVHTTKPVAILGINLSGLESGNPEITNGRILPWLQDSTQVNVWNSWHANWRDVVVLDARNHRLAVYNLTQHDLARTSAFDSLKTILLGDAGQ